MTQLGMEYRMQFTQSMPCAWRPKGSRLKDVEWGKNFYAFSKVSQEIESIVNSFGRVSAIGESILKSY
jgi:hypothetical protein